MSTNAEFFNLVGEIVMRPSDMVVRGYAVQALPLVLQNLDNTPFHPWFLEKEGAVSLVADIDNGDLPEDFLDFLEDNDVYRYPGDEGDAKKTMTRGFYEEIQDVYANQDTGPPDAYDLVGTKLYVGPTPDAAYTLRFWYMQKTTAPADNSDEVSNVWILNAQDYVAHLLASRIARHKLRDKELASDLRDEAGALRGELFRMNEARKHTNMDYSVNK